MNFADIYPGNPFQRVVSRATRRTEPQIALRSIHARRHAALRVMQINARPPACARMPAEWGGLACAVTPRPSCPPVAFTYVTPKGSLIPKIS
jgi:hypothetical protein